MFRRSLAAILCCAAALPAAARPLGFDDARHLLNRTSFAANTQEIQEFSQLTRAAAADRLLGWAGRAPTVPAPEWTRLRYEPPPRPALLSDEARKDYQRQLIGQARDLKAWWMAEMLTTPSPLTEKMVLFWHNHFVSSLRKVRMPLLMYRQHVALRQHALGSFRDMLHAMARDPAMLIYLDGAASRKGQPNENFAREVMELFTLGEGRYTEDDVKEAARAFTGWSVDRETGEFMSRPAVHDAGIKIVLGVTGRHDGAAVLDILLARPETAEFIVSKLWREFIAAEPDLREVRSIAQKFRTSGYDIRTALRELLTSDAFYAPQNTASLVKSPVDLVVGTLRQFRMTVADPLPFALTVGRLGQDLFAPPNVRGWPGGDAWINATTLLARKQFLEMAFRGSEAGMQPAMQGALRSLQFDGDAWFAQFGGAPGRWQRVVFAGQPVSAVAGQGMDALRVAVQDPAYQLK
jgi:uncharacterized protein (DUF1800 family)